MTKKSAFAVSLAISLLIAAAQFYFDFAAHKHFVEVGVIAKMDATFRPHSDVNYAAFTFRTQNGELVSESRKCGSEEDFIHNYENKSVIYDPSNTKRFELFNEFQSYNVSYRIMFFCLYAMIIFIFLYGCCQVWLRIAKKSI